jgi:hypothetical protein
MCFVPSRHLCLAAATRFPEPAVLEVAVDEVDGDEVDDVEEVAVDEVAVDEVAVDEVDGDEVDDFEEPLELPHALTAVAATTSRTGRSERLRIMPPSSRKKAGRQPSTR